MQLNLFSKFTKIITFDEQFPVRIKIMYDKINGSI